MRGRENGGNRDGRRGGSSGTNASNWYVQKLLSFDDQDPTTDDQDPTALIIDYRAHIARSREISTGRAGSLPAVLGIGRAGSSPAVLGIGRAGSLPAVLSTGRAGSLPAWSGFQDVW